MRPRHVLAGKEMWRRWQQNPKLDKWIKRDADTRLDEGTPFACFLLQKEDCREYHEISSCDDGFSWLYYPMINRPTLLKKVRSALRRSRVVALIGPRQCGKTTLARELVSAESVNYFDLEDPASLARERDPHPCFRHPTRAAWPARSPVPANVPRVCMQEADGGRGAADRGVRACLPQ